MYQPSSIKTLKKLSEAQNLMAKASLEGGVPAEGSKDEDSQGSDYDNESQGE